MSEVERSWLNIGFCQGMFSSRPLGLNLTFLRLLFLDWVSDFVELSAVMIRQFDRVNEMQYRH